MNYPVWELPAPGLLIALVGIVHVFISHFAVGGGLFLVLAERRARREQDAALLAFVRSLSRGFVLLTLVLGALTGVGIWFTIGLVQPQATSALVTVFVWAWAVEWTTFAVEIAAALVYYHGWDRLTPEAHLRVGWIYFASAWASLAVISGILSFMMTSGDWPQTRAFADAFFNPGYAPTVVLRSAGAAGLTGLYVLFAAAIVGDADLKARLARFVVGRFTLPATVVVPAALLWLLAVADRAGVAVAETIGAANAGPLSLLQALFSTTAGGQPIVRAAGRAALLATAALVVGSLFVGLVRPRRFGRPFAAALLLLGLVSIGSAEFLREGLRKPWLIDRYMFVNGVRVPAPPGAPARIADPFALDALARSGMLSVSPWVAESARPPGDQAFELLAPEARADRLAEAGSALFRLECAICHTAHGRLGMRRLVAGRSASAMTAVLDALARPAGGAEPGPEVPPGRLATWRGRRMPPFAGSAAEKHALAVYLARLGGDVRAGLESPPAAAAGATVFERHCAACHGAEAPWPIAGRLRALAAGELYELLGRLPELREEMPPFSGSDEERGALAQYLAGLAAAASEEPPR